MCKNHEINESCEKNPIDSTTSKYILRNHENEWNETCEIKKCAKCHV